MDIPAYIRDLKGVLYLGCYYIYKDQVWVSNPNLVSKLILTVTNALIEKYDYYWRIIPITPGTPLEPERHQVIKDGQIVDPYCDICKDRLIAISGGCQSCAFFPICAIEPMRMSDLVIKLRDAGYFETDFVNFKKQLHHHSAHHENKRRSSL
jgi:hypothetical protein